MTHQATPIALTVVPSKYTPLFAILALVQNAGVGGLIHRMWQFLLRLRLPSGKARLHCLWGGGAQARGGEMLPTLVVG